MFKKFYFVLFLIILFHASFSQPFHNHSSPEYFFPVESAFNKNGDNFHTAIRPYYQNQLTQYVSLDSNKNSCSILSKKLFSENLINYKNRNFTLVADPLFAIISAYDFSNSTLFFESDCGIALRSRLAENLVFSADLLYNYSGLPSYLKSSVDSLHIIPGEGFAHKAGDYYEYHNPSFYLAYTLPKYFIFEAGFGKNFWGDGYRSLILSENAYNYPYLKIETNIWKIKYINLWVNFKDIRNAASSGWRDFYNKYGTFHFLSWNLTKKINIGFYEAIIWQDRDSTGVRGFDVNYANPVIFFRPIEFSLGSPDNALMGLNIKYKINYRHILYGQIVIDDMVTPDLKNDFKHLFKPGDTTINYGSWMNKQAFQLGIKIFDVFEMKNLYFQTELNAARPYTYSHRMSHQNYGHFNQPLAHPLGANFWESYSLLRYNKNRWFFELKFMYAIAGIDSANSHFGQNIYQPTFYSPIPSTHNIPVNQYKNQIGQGIKTNIIFNELKISYLINRKNNLRIEAGFIYRQQKNTLLTTQNNFVFLGIRTSLFNGYSDY
ncbi:MAG: hypothetical protein HY958_09580 [Bacteroidia bacterium]|nr:hypothetical protein [Bacteroidia bacterium]